MNSYVQAFYRHAGLRFALLLLGLFLGLPAAFATHIVGGEMELQYRSGNTYTLTLNLYFDAINGNPGALDQQMTASIFDKANNRRMQNVSLPLIGNTFVQYTNPACTTPTLSTRKLVYSREIILDADNYTSNAGYYAAIERCCRNNGISNIVSPGGAAQTFYLEFPAVMRNRQRFIDSTPRIFPPLGDYACRGEMFYYDFSGQDVDGDSLVYDLVTPLNGSASDFAPAPTQASTAPYRLINWLPGRSTTNQIPGDPTLTIDARTGRLMVRPTQLGLFVFGVRCSEYRNKVKIGETRRDFQLYALNCPQNAKPNLQVFNQVGGRPYRPKLDTLRLIPGGNRCLTMRFTDPDPSSRLTLTTLPVNFSGLAPSFTSVTTGTVRAPGAPDTLTATLCFPECQDTQGKVYLLDVIVADNGCSLPKKDTIRVAFTAIPPANVPPVLTSTFPPEAAPVSTPVVVQVPVGTIYTATLDGTDADQNALVMSAAGQGFDLGAAGMRFTAQNGTGRANGTFSWLASCDAAQLQDNLTVTFQLQETARCTPKPQTRTVRFMVVPAPDTTKFLPPNIITPNGDGKNDAFELTQLPPDLCDGRFGGIKIFSRWGNEVFQSPARTFRWNGAGSAGMYYYLITFTDGRRYKGWLQVLP